MERQEINVQKEVINEKFFNRGWNVIMFKDGEGFSIQLYQFEGFVKSWFRFDQDAAEKVFLQVCKEFKK